MRSLVLSRHDVQLDAAACQASRLVPRYLGPDHPDPAYRDALAYPDGWAELCPVGWIYLCPPYVPVNYLERFLELAVRTARAGTPVCALLPASVGVKWFTKHVLHAGGTPELLEERLVYGGPHSSGKPAPWGSTLVTWQF